MRRWSTAAFSGSGNTYTPSRHSLVGFTKRCATLTRAMIPLTSIATSVKSSGDAVRAPLASFRYSAPVPASPAAVVPLAVAAAAPRTGAACAGVVTMNTASAITRLTTSPATKLSTTNLASSRHSRRMTPLPVIRSTSAMLVSFFCVSGKPVVGSWRHPRAPTGGTPSMEPISRAHCGGAVVRKGAGRRGKVANLWQCRRLFPSPWPSLAGRAIACRRWPLERPRACSGRPRSRSRKRGEGNPELTRGIATRAQVRSRRGRGNRVNARNAAPSPAPAGEGWGEGGRAPKPTAAAHRAPSRYSRVRNRGTTFAAPAAPTLHATHRHRRRRTRHPRELRGRAAPPRLRGRRRMRTGRTRWPRSARGCPTWRWSTSAWATTSTAASR